MHELLASRGPPKTQILNASHSSVTFPICAVCRFFAQCKRASYTLAPGACPPGPRAAPQPGPRATQRAGGGVASQVAASVFEQVAQAERRTELRRVSRSVAAMLLTEGART